MMLVDRCSSSNRVRLTTLLIVAAVLVGGTFVSYAAMNSSLWGILKFQATEDGTIVNEDGATVGETVTNEDGTLSTNINLGHGVGIVIETIDPQESLQGKSIFLGSEVKYDSDGRHIRIEPIRDPRADQ